MKEKMIESFPLPLKLIMSHECENCGYEFIIFDRRIIELNWSVLGIVSYCPRCGAEKGRVAYHPADTHIHKWAKSNDVNVVLYCETCGCRMMMPQDNGNRK